MQFTFITLLSLVAVALAAPVSLAMPERLDDISARQTAPAVTAEAPAMTDKDGNVVSFDSASVYLATTAAGQ